MGAQESKLPASAAAHQRAVVDRLRALQLEKIDGADDGYVHVDEDGNANEKAHQLAIARQPETLRVELIEKWQEALLEDPKNR